MLFAAKVVESNATGSMLIKVGFVAVAFVAVSMLLPSMAFLVPFFLIAVLFVVIVVAIVTKGNLSSYKLENDLVIFDTEMQICHFIFPMDEIKELTFIFKSFNAGNNSGTNSDTGLENVISFRYKSQHFKYKFYIQSQQHFNTFVQMLEQLYIAQVNFEEQNGKGKTFMMQHVNQAQYDTLMRKYQPY